MIPPPDDNIKLSDYSGDILSIKTTARERFRQDKFLKSDKTRVVLISLEEVNDNSILSIKIDKNKRNFHNYVKSIKSNQ